MRNLSDLYLVLRRIKQAPEIKKICDNGGDEYIQSMCNLFTIAWGMSLDSDDHKNSSQQSTAIYNGRMLNTLLAIDCIEDGYLQLKDNKHDKPS